MKRLLSIILSLCICFTFFACNKADEENETTTKAPETSATFVKPKDYSTVLLISINPQFRLYLDADGNVLAVEAVNDDAKGIVEKLDFKDKDYKTVVEEIVTESQKDGFVKDDVTINVGIVESKNESDEKTEMIAAIETAVSDTAKELDVKITVDVKDESEPESTEAETTAAPTTTTKHTHSFSAATCTSPKKCSCGATSGSALGHNYVSGVCTRCNAKDPNYFTPVANKSGTWKTKYLSGNELYKVTLSVSENFISVGIGDLFSTLPEDMQEKAKSDCESYNGNLYYFGKGDGAPVTVTESNNVITVTDSSGNKIVLSRTAENTMKCTSVSSAVAICSNMPVGTVLTFTAG